MLNFRGPHMNPLIRAESSDRKARVRAGALQGPILAAFAIADGQGSYGSAMQVHIHTCMHTHAQMGENQHIQTRARI